MADSRLQHASTVGRHQAAADAVPSAHNQSPQLVLDQQPSQGDSMFKSPDGQQAPGASQDQQHEPMQSLSQRPGPQDQSLAHSPQSPEKQPDQQALPITSPFKKVPSPWEKGQKAAAKGSPKGTTSQVSLPSAPRQSQSPLLGKRKHREEQEEQGVKQLQHIIAQAGDVAEDRTRDSLLLDTLEGVPDNQAMPFSLEDKGAGLSDTAANNMKGSSMSPQKAKPQQAKGRSSGPRKAALQEAKGRLGNQHLHDGSAAAQPADSRSNIDPAIDLTTHPQQTSSSQPIEFDDMDDELEAGLIAAADRSTAEHASAGMQQKQPVRLDVSANAADDAADIDAAANPNAQADQDSEWKHQQSAGSQAAGIIHRQQQQQQQQTRLQQQESNAQQMDDRRPGISDSLPAPSELGLGEYGSAALEGGPSVGVSSTLPSFDLDAEMASLDKQSKVSYCGLWLPHQVCLTSPSQASVSLWTK